MNTRVEGLKTTYSEERKVPRYTLTATVEISEPDSGIHFSGRIAEISRKGCFVDVLNTMPKDTPLRLCVTRDCGTFVTPGRVIYVQSAVGMGIAFEKTPTEQMNTLEAWLAEFAS